MITLELRKNAPNRKSANRNPPSFSRIQWEQRKVAYIAAAIFRMGIEQTICCIEQIIISKEQHLSRFEMKIGI
jgi:hypothetical protein